MVTLRGPVWGLLVAFALAGCTTVGQDYKLPAQAVVNAPAAQGPFVGVKGQSAVVQAPLPDQWWRLYDSPALDRLVGEALAANTDLRVAEANLERSRALVAQAEAAGQPNVVMSLDAGRAQLSAEQYLHEGAIPPLNLYDAGLSASYELDLFGRIRRGVEAAKADDEAVAAARDWVQVSVVADVARAYADVCSAGQQLAVARSSLALRQKSLDLTRALVAAGRGSRLDLTRSQGDIDLFRASIPTLQAAQANALFRLATLTGKPPALFDASLAQCAAAPVLTQPIPVGDGAALLKRRPDVRAAERQLAAATAEIGVAVSALYPDVRLGASIGSTGAAQDFIADNTNRYAVGPGVVWQLNQSVARARIDQANAAQKAALARFDGVVLSALREVESSLNVYAHDLDRERSLTAAVAQAQSALDDAHRLQTAGKTGALATLDAERVLIGAQAAEAAAQAQIAQDQVALFLALGGGWQSAKG
jgi:NodT family efflux transporter outer membrane factor (OMF) lipoprotein